MSNVYQQVTDKIIEQLKLGVVPWHIPWTVLGAPVNLVTNKKYKGINRLLLSITATVNGYESPYWMTFKQAKALGGYVRAGEKGTFIVFWGAKIIKDNDKDESKQIMFLKSYVVFNSDQCDKVEIPKVEKKEIEPIAEAQSIVDMMPDCPRILYGGDRAYYSMSKDVVSVPKISSFDSPESYYRVLFHELVHSTGHSSRLNRFDMVEPAPFGSTDYSQEELVAELGAAFLSQHVGIAVNHEESASYISAWIEKLENDKRFLIQASSKAQRAVDFITVTDNT